MVVPQRQAANARPRAAAGPKPSSQYTGLTWDGNTRTWRVRINARSQQHHVGRFRDIAEAAQTYDCAALLLLGPSAAVNFGAAAAGAAMPRFLARIGPAALKKLRDAAVLAQQLDGTPAPQAAAAALPADPSAACGVAAQQGAPQPAFATPSPSPLGPGPFSAAAPAGAAGCWGSYWQQQGGAAAGCPTPGPCPPTPPATEGASGGLPLEPLGSMCSLDSACSSMTLDAGGSCSSGGSFPTPAPAASCCGGGGLPSAPPDWAGGALAGGAPAAAAPGYAAGDATMAPAWCPLDDELDRMLWQLESSAAGAPSAPPQQQQQPSLPIAAAAAPRGSFGPAIASPPLPAQQQQQQQQLPVGVYTTPSTPIAALYWQWATEGPDGTTCAVDLRCFQ